MYAVFMLRRVKAYRYHVDKNYNANKIYIKRGRYMKKAIVIKNLLNNYLRIQTTDCCRDR